MYTSKATIKLDLELIIIHTHTHAHTYNTHTNKQQVYSYSSVLLKRYVYTGRYDFKWLILLPLLS